MRILIISRSFYPIVAPRSFRATELSKQLAQEGHEISVLTHLEEGFEYIRDEYRIKFINLKKPYFKALKISKGIYEWPSRIFQRFLNLFFDYPDSQLAISVYNALKKVNLGNFDLIISIASPHPIHWGVALYKLFHSRIKFPTWIADCGDPYMGDKADSFNRLFYFKYVEKFWFKHSDFVTIPIENARNAYYREFHDKIHVIPQGFNFEEVKGLENNFKINENLIQFCYAGTFIPGVRDPKALFEYLVELNFEFKFFIFTKKPEKLEKYRKLLGNKLILNNYIPRLELMKIMSTMDFLINFENLSDVQSPSKLIDYFLCKRPVFSIKYNDFHKDVFNEFLNRDYKNKYCINDINQYNIKSVAEHFIRLVKIKH